MPNVTNTRDEINLTHHVSPVFGDLIAKATLAIDLEIERRLRLGLPVVSTEVAVSSS